MIWKSPLKNIFFVTKTGFWFFQMITRGSHYFRQLERIYILVRALAHYQNASTWRKTLRQQEKAESMLYKLWALPIRSTAFDLLISYKVNPCMGRKCSPIEYIFPASSFSQRACVLGWTSSVRISETLC